MALMVFAMQRIRMFYPINISSPCNIAASLKLAVSPRAGGIMNDPVRPIRASPGPHLQPNISFVLEDPPALNNIFGPNFKYYRKFLEQNMFVLKPDIRKRLMYLAYVWFLIQSRRFASSWPSNQFHSLIGPVLLPFTVQGIKHTSIYRTDYSKKEAWLRCHCLRKENGKAIVITLLNTFLISAYWHD